MFLLKTIKEKNAKAEQYLQHEKLYQYGKALKQAISMYPEYTNAKQAEAAADILAKTLFRESQTKLLHLLSVRDLTQTELDTFLKNWDIEAVHSSEALLLACIIQEHPDLHCEDAISPRLGGIMDYYRFRSLDLLFHFSRIIRAMNKLLIFPINLNGNTIQSVHSELYGIIRTIEILLPEDTDAATVIRIISELGYKYDKTTEMITIHVTGKITSGIIRVFPFHPFSEKYGMSFAADLSHMATKAEMFNEIVLFPRIEDQLLLQLINIADTIRGYCNRQNLFFSAADLLRLMQSECEPFLCFSEKNVIRTTKKAECLIGAYFINQFTPDIVPGEFLNNTEYDTILSQQTESDKKYIRKAFGNPAARQFTVIRSRSAAKRKHL